MVKLVTEGTIARRWGRLTYTSTTCGTKRAVGADRAPASLPRVGGGE